MALEYPKAPYMLQAGRTNPIKNLTQALVGMQENVEAEKIKNIDKELSDYFISNTMSGESGFSVVDGDLSYDSNFKVPTFNEGWQKYKGVFKKYGKDVGMDGYMAYKQAYSQMTEMHANQLKNDIIKWTNAGYSEKDIRKALGNNQSYLDNYSTLISDPVKGQEYSSWMAPYGPRKSLWDDLDMRDISTAAAGVGTAAAVGKYFTGRGAEKAISEADQILKEYKDSSAYKNASAAGKRKITKDTKAKVAKMKADANVSTTSKLIKRAGKLGGAGKLAAYGIGTNLAQAGAETLFDSEEAGELVGATAGAGLNLAATIGPVIQNAIGKHGIKKVINQIASKGGLKLAASLLTKGALTGSGVGTIIGAGLLASDLYQIYDILQDMD